MSDSGQREARHEHQVLAPATEGRQRFPPSIRPTPLMAIFVAALFIAIGCHPRQAHRAIRGEPAMQATVVTIRTTIQPQNRTFSHSLIIGSDRARSGDEVDEWRLFDLKNNRVTFVDEVSKTYRIEPMPPLVKAMNEAALRPLPPGVPIVSVTRGTERRTLQGVEASPLLMRAGTYVREVWIGQHPSIPPQLFSMMLASAPPASPLAAMTKAVNAALLGTSGFPLVDRAEIAFDDKKMTVEKTVVKIEKKNVPQSWLNVSPAYKDVTPRATPPPAVRKPARR